MLNRAASADYSSASSGSLDRRLLMRAEDFASSMQALPASVSLSSAVAEGQPTAYIPVTAGIGLPARRPAVYVSIPPTPPLPTTAAARVFWTSSAYLGRRSDGLHIDVSPATGTLTARAAERINRVKGPDIPARRRGTAPPPTKPPPGDRHRGAAISSHTGSGHGQESLPGSTPRRSEYPVGLVGSVDADEAAPRRALNSGMQRRVVPTRRQRDVLSEESLPDAIPSSVPNYPQQNQDDRPPRAFLTSASNA